RAARTRSARWARASCTEEKNPASHSASRVDEGHLAYVSAGRQLAQHELCDVLARNLQALDLPAHRRGFGGLSRALVHELERAQHGPFEPALPEQLFGSRVVRVRPPQE